jgi:hypothetical protein
MDNTHGWDETRTSFDVQPSAPQRRCREGKQQTERRERRRDR